MLELTQYKDDLKRSFLQLLEHRCVIEHAADIFDYQGTLEDDIQLAQAEAERQEQMDPLARADRLAIEGRHRGRGSPSGYGSTERHQPLLNEGGAGLGAPVDSSVLHDPAAAEQGQGGSATGGIGRGLSLRFQSVAGVMHERHINRFRRILFRTTRGNALVKFSAIEDASITQALAQRGDVVAGGSTKAQGAAHFSVFVVLYRAAALTPKIIKMCDAFGASRYELPDFDSPSQVEAEVSQLEHEMHENAELLRQNTSMVSQALQGMTGSLGRWRMALAREKAIYATLNKLEPTARGMLQGRVRERRL